MYAVTSSGFHIDLGTQNHVPTLTTCLSSGGAVFVSNIFSNFEILLRATDPALGAASSRTQSYPCIELSHMRAYNDRRIPSEPITLIASFALRPPFVTESVGRQVHEPLPFCAGVSN